MSTAQTIVSDPDSTKGKITSECHVIAVVINKGGAGKTMFARTTADGLARKGLRVLLIDLDPQCNLSRRFLDMENDPGPKGGLRPPVHPAYDPDSDDDSNWDGRCHSADIYHDGEVDTYPTYIDNLEILPAHKLLLRNVDLVSGSEMELKVISRLAAWVQLQEVQNIYDVIVLDTPPAISPITLSALRAATHLMIPTIPDPQGFEGVESMIKEYVREKRIRDDDRPLELLGIIPNNVRSTVLHTDYINKLRTTPVISDFTAPFIIKQRTAFAEVDHPDFTPPSVFTMRKSSPVRQDAEQLVSFVYDKLYGGGDV